MNNQKTTFAAASAISTTFANDSGHRIIGASYALILTILIFLIMSYKRKSLQALMLAFAAVLLTGFTGCQQESDEITGNITGLGMEKYASKYTEIWDVLWKGINQNYVGWENETIDWDEVNATTRPQMEVLDAKLDTLSKQNKLDATTGRAIAAEASRLFHSAIDSLHDGHLYIAYRDRYTDSIKALCPTLVHEKQRKDYGELQKTIRLTKSYYKQNGQIAEGTYKAFSSYSAAYRMLKEEIRPELSEILSGGYTVDQYDADALKAYLNYLDLFLDNKITAEEFDYIIFSSGKYNDIIQLYGLFPMSFDDTIIQMFITSDNIAYFFLNSFMWPSNTDLSNYRYDISSSYDMKINSYIAEWHDMVYKMHQEGTLKGVILDVRSNSGGANDNLKYFAGTLFKGSQYQVGTKKMKNGVGRLDYTAPTPLYMDCYGTNTEDITEPIVILTNPASASCAEFSTAAVKQHENGISIGTTTAGMGASLFDTPDYYSTLGYAGVIGTYDGIQNKTCSVYAYIPFMVTNYGGGIGSIESKGIAPDIEITYDEDLSKSTGRDNQFERALTYIREGK